LKRSAIFRSRGGELLRPLTRRCAPEFPRGYTGQIPLLALGVTGQFVLFSDQYARVPEMNANYAPRRSLEETGSKPTNLPGRIQP
jgi:hypothetical protein